MFKLSQHEVFNVVYKELCARPYGEDLKVAADIATALWQAEDEKIRMLVRNAEDSR